VEQQAQLPWLSPLVSTFGHRLILWVQFHFLSVVLQMYLQTQPESELVLGLCWVLLIAICCCRMSFASPLARTHSIAASASPVVGGGGSGSSGGPVGLGHGHGHGSPAHPLAHLHGDSAAGAGGSPAAAGAPKLARATSIAQLSKAKAKSTLITPKRFM
jgi:hypothetical protein